MKKSLNRAPNNYYESFKSLIIDATNNVKDKRRIEDLFELFEPTTKKNTSILDTTKEKIKKIAEKKIIKLAGEISADMKTFREKEIAIRGSTLKELRESEGLSKLNLANLLKTKDKSITEKFITNIENGNKKMTKITASLISEELIIPIEILLPHCFYS